MTGIPQMTWNWKWKAAATGATALAGWLASPPLQPSSAAARGARGAVDTSAARSAANAATVSDIEEQARRLVARPLPPDAAAAPSRNLFRFQVKAVRAPKAAVAPPAFVPPPPAPFPFTVTGIATDVVNGAEKRTAILSGQSGLAIAGEGEIAAPGYRVVTVGEASVDVERLSDGVREHLRLKP